MIIFRHPDDGGGFKIPDLDDNEELDLNVDDNDSKGSTDGGGGTYKVRYDNRIAKMDISESSKEDHRFMTRYTRKEAENFLKKDYLYLKKGLIMPFAIVEDYQFKKNPSDKDVPEKNNSNVSMGMVIAIGRLPKWKNIMHQINESAYILGECMYVQRGKYDIGELKPHIALVVSKKYKIIKPIDIRDLFDPIKNELQNGAPYVIYKEFPKPL